MENSGHELLSSRHGNLALAPLLDLLNHSPHVQVRATRHVIATLSCLLLDLQITSLTSRHCPVCRQVSAGFNVESQCYEISSQCSYRKHEQVFISYGPHDNIKLLVEYGFTVPDNPHSSVPIYLS